MASRGMESSAPMMACSMLVLIIASWMLSPVKHEVVMWRWHVPALSSFAALASPIAGEPR